MAFNMSGLNASELQEVGATLSNADSYGNSKDIELRWAMKAMDHATVHYNLISSVDASRLRLTKVDDKIYKQFREEFPDFNVANIKEDDLKTAEAKQKWRNFCESFKDEIEDYNLGTLLRLNCGDDYSPETTTFSVRTQFLAIEIARNKEGHNNILLEKSKEKQQPEVAKTENA